VVVRFASSVYRRALVHSGERISFGAALRGAAI
jgi:hypothetical protein